MHSRLFNLNNFVVVLIAVGVINIATTDPEIKNAGRVALGLAPLLALGWLSINGPRIVRNSTRVNAVILAFVIYLLVNIMSLLTLGPSLWGIYVTLQIAAAGIVFIYAAAAAWTKKELRVLFLLSHAVVLLSWWFYSQHDYSMRQQAIGNLLFGMSYSVFALALLSRGTWIRIYSGLFGIALGFWFYLLGARAALLGYSFTLLVFLLWSLFVRSHFIYAVFFIAVLISGFVFVCQYPALSDQPFLSQLDTVMFEETGQHLFSGRHLVWEWTFTLFSQRPLWGYGVSAQVGYPFFPAYSLLSTHSFYLHTLLQTGLIGLTAFLAILVSIWRFFWVYRQVSLCRLSGAFLVGICVQQLFEVSWTQNNLAIGSMYWVIIGIGLSYAIRSADLEDGLGSGSSTILSYHAAQGWVRTTSTLGHR